MSESFLTKLQALKAYYFIKKRHQLRCFPMNVANILRAPNLKKISNGCFCNCSIENFNIEHKTNFNLYVCIQKQPPEVFYKKGVLWNFTRFTGKHLCQSLAQVFFCEFCGISKNTFLQNTSGRLLLFILNCYNSIKAKLFVRSWNM